MGTSPKQNKGAQEADTDSQAKEREANDGTQRGTEAGKKSRQTKTTQTVQSDKGARCPSSHLEGPRRSIQLTCERERA